MRIRVYVGKTHRIDSNTRGILRESALFLVYVCVWEREREWFVAKAAVFVTRKYLFAF